MAWTQDQVDAAKTAYATAIASGAEQLSYADGSGVRYFAPKDFLFFIQAMEADVAATTPVNPDPTLRPVRAFRGSLCSGY